jgi:hypothetical protein
VNGGLSAGFKVQCLGFRHLVQTLDKLACVCVCRSCVCVCII